MGGAGGLDWAVIMVRGGSKGQRKERGAEGEEERGLKTKKTNKKNECAGDGGGQETNLGMKLDQVVDVGRHAWKKPPPFRVSHYRRHLRITGEHLTLISSHLRSHPPTTTAHRPPPPPFFFFDPPLDNAPLGPG